MLLVEPDEVFIGVSSCETPQEELIILDIVDNVLENPNITDEQGIDGIDIGSREEEEAWRRIKFGITDDMEDDLDLDPEVDELGNDVGDIDLEGAD